MSASSTFKGSKTAATKPTPVKRGSRVLGHIHTAEDGTQLYLARRKIADMYRQGEKSLSEAVRAGKAAWGLDEEILFKMRAQGVPLVGVEVKETGETYLINIERMFEPGLFFTHRRMRGAERCVPLTHFQRSPARFRV
jgi:hypothetical protein